MQDHVADSVLLYIVGMVRVDLKNRHQHDPKKALEEAISLVGDSDLIMPPGTFGLSGNEIQFQGWNDVLGGLVDMQNDPEYKHTEYVTADTNTVLSYLPDDCLPALLRVVESGGGRLEDLRIVINTATGALLDAAWRGVLAHEDATDQDIREALAYLAEGYTDGALSLLRWLSSNDTACRRIRPEHLAPFLSCDDRTVREYAQRLISKLNQSKHATSDVTQRRRRIHG